MPRAVTAFTEKKSQAHNVFLCLSRNWFHLSDVRFGAGSIPSSFRMLRTVCRLNCLMPSFRSSPTIRVYPNADCPSRRFR